MTADLPDDPNRWPEDPYRLLGIDRDADERTARRAYLKLVRQYKPEHHPEAFRRIREAFEQVERYAQYRSAYEEEVPPFLRSSDQQRDLGDSPVERDAPTRGEEPNVPATRVDDALDAAWQTACDGNPGTALAQLEQARGRFGTTLGLALREYWLRRMYPELEPAGDAFAVLIDAVVRSELQGPAMELLRREIEARPQRALVPEFDALLTCEAPLPALVELLEWRFVAAGRLNCEDVIATDIDAMRSRLNPDDTWWPRILIAAINQLAWSQQISHQDCVSAWIEEIEELSHVQLEMDDALAGLDFLCVLVESWDAARHNTHVVESVTRLVEQSWRFPLRLWNEEMRRFIAVAAANPGRMLVVLDAARTGSLAVVAQLQNALRQYQYANHLFAPTEPDDRLRSLVAEFLLTWRAWKPDQLRAEIFNFCLDNFLRPTELIAVAYEDSQFRTSTGLAELNDLIAQDLALLCAYETYHLFWLGN